MIILIFCPWLKLHVEGMGRMVYLDIFQGKGPTLFSCRGRVVNNSQINQVKRNTRNINENNRNTQKKPAETNPRTLANQKSTSSL